jgi:hypothetical protein
LGGTTGIFSKIKLGSAITFLAFLQNAIPTQSPLFFDEAMMSDRIKYTLDCSNRAGREIVIVLVITGIGTFPHHKTTIA